MLSRNHTHFLDYGTEGILIAFISSFHLVPQRFATFELTLGKGDAAATIATCKILAIS
jgi:hypothetical protein